MEIADIQPSGHERDGRRKTLKPTSNSTLIDRRIGGTRGTRRHSGADDLRKNLGRTRRRQNDRRIEGISRPGGPHGIVLAPTEFDMIDPISIRLVVVHIDTA
jgi:hypothetical protein